MRRPVRIPGFRAPRSVGRARIPRALSAGEEAFWRDITTRPEVPEMLRQYRFHLEREWLLDFAAPKFFVCVEIEGGTWSNGRHTRGSSFEDDLEKYNVATANGWRVFRFTTAQAVSGFAGAFMAEFFSDLVKAMGLASEAGR